MAWGVYVQEYQSLTAAGTSTTTTNIYIPNHGLSDGDAIVNTTRINLANDVLASRRVLSASDTSNLTVAAITGQTASDTIRLYKHVDRTNKVKCESLRIIKRNDRTSMLNLTFVSDTSWYPQTGQDIQVKNGSTIVYGGTIKTVKRKLVRETTACSTLFYDVYSEGYNHIPARRTVSLTYDNTTAGTIVQSMLENALYDELVASASITSGISITEYDETANLRQVFDGLADASGCKWYINESRNLYFVSDDTIASAAHSLVDGNGYTSYSNVQYEEQTEEYRNKQFVVGGLNDEGLDSSAIVRNLDQIQGRMEIEGSSGVYGDVYSDSRIETDDDAHTVAEQRIKQWGTSVPAILTFNSLSTDWLPNTRMQLSLAALGLSVSSTCTIDEVEIYDFTGNTAGTFLQSRITATRRDDENLGSHSKEDYITYFGRLVEFAKEKNSSGVSVGTASSVACSNHTSTADKTLNTATETVANSVDVVFPVRSKAVIMYSCEINTTAAVTVTAKTYINSAAQTFQPSDMMEAGKNKFTFHDTITGIGAGTKPVEIKLQSDIATGIISAGESVLTVMLFDDPPAGLDDVTNFTANATSDTSVVLTWTNPTTAYFDEVNLYHYSANISEKNHTWCSANTTLLYNGTATTTTHSGLTATTTVYYKIFAVYDTGV